MPLFLFILILYSKYIHSITFIKYIHPSSFAEVPICISSLLVSSVGKTSYECKPRIELHVSKGREGIALDFGPELVGAYYLGKG